MPIPAPSHVHADDVDEAGGATGAGVAGASEEATETEEEAELAASQMKLMEMERRLVVTNLRLLREQLLLEPSWPPQRRPLAAPGAPV